MTIEQEVKAALSAEHPVLALRSLVKSVHRDGVSKGAIQYKLREYSRHLAASDIEREHLQEVVDALSGSCEPKQRLIPGKPDVFL